MTHIRLLERSVAGRTSEQMNRRIYALTVVSTLLLPLSLLAGVFGANISTRNGNILGADHPAWFIGICIGLVAIGLGIRIWLLRRRLL